MDEVDGTIFISTLWDITVGDLTNLNVVRLGEGAVLDRSETFHKPVLALITALVVDVERMDETREAATERQAESVAATERQAESVGTVDNSVDISRLPRRRQFEFAERSRESELQEYTVSGRVQTTHT